MTDDRDARIDRLCAEYLAAAESGRAPDRTAWLQQHPDLADPLAEFLDCLSEVGRRVASLRSAAGETIDAPTGPPDAPPGATVPAPPGYEILGKLAEGGMGVVYRARAVELNRVVALKMIRAGALSGESAALRFHQEAEAAAGFDHPHIVPIYEVGVTPAGDPYFSMKLVEGRTLADWIADGPHRTASGLLAGIRLLAAVARAVHHAHQRGILHRDLKPANVLLDAAGVPYVTDFGLAKRLTDSPERSLTQDGGMVGTLGYMAPEQARGEKALTTAADVYSLGAILFHVLTGRPLRPGGTLAEVFAHIGKEPPRPRAVNPQTDRDLEAICLKCLADAPASRFGSAEALADDLDRWWQGRPTRTRPPGSARQLWMWARRRPDVAALSAVTLLVFLAGTGLVGWKWRAEAAARREVQAEAARSAAVVAQGLLEEGTDGDPENLGGAMLWWARSFRLAPEGCAREQSTARANLAALSGRAHTLSEVWDRSAPASPFVISPDGRRGATADGTTVRLLDPRTGHESGSVPHAGVKVVAFSPDGDWLATAGGGFVRAWSLGESPTLDLELPTEEPVVAVAVTARPGGRRVAVAGTRRVHLFDGGRPAGNALDVASVDALAFDRDGGRLATGGADEFVRVWDAATGKPIGQPLAHDDGVRALAFSPDGKKLITGSDDHVARVWSVGEDAPPLKLEHQDYVWAVAFSPDGRLVATGGADSAAQVWEADTGRRAGQLLRHGGGVAAVGFAAGGTELVTSGTDGAVRVWKLSAAARTERAVSLGAAVFAVTAISDGSELDAGTGRGVYRLDQLTPDSPTHATAPACDNVLISVTGGAAVTGPPGCEVWAVARASPGGWVAAGGRAAGESGWLRVSRADGTAARSFWFKQPVRSLSFAPDRSRLLAATADPSSGGAWLWDATAPNSVPTPLLKGESVWAVAFSPDGTRYVTSAGDGTVKVWRTDSPTDRPVLLDHPRRVVALAFHPDGERLVTASTDRHVRVWDTTTGAKLSESSAHRGAVWAVAVSPDGHLVATAGRDRCVRVWDAATGTPVGAPLRHRGVVWAVTFGRDGKHLWSGSEYGTARGGEGGTVCRWRAPTTTLNVPDAQVETWTEVVTGLRLDGDRVRVLGPSEWRELRDRLIASGVPAD